MYPASSASFGAESAAAPPDGTDIPRDLDLEAIVRSRRTEDSDSPIEVPIFKMKIVQGHSESDKAKRCDS